MAEYSLVHIGLNAADPEEALKTAQLFGLAFGLEVKPGNSSVFAGTLIEVMKSPYRGTHGHIALGTPDVDAAKAELEAKGFTFAEETAKYNEDGTMKFIYLSGEFGGFAVHLLCKK